MRLCDGNGMGWDGIGGSWVFKNIIAYSCSKIEMLDGRYLLLRPYPTSLDTTFP